MEDKYVLGKEQNRDFLKNQRDALFGFGHGFVSPEGGAYYLGDAGEPWKDRPRETWITSRMTHVYSMASMLGHDGAREFAASAVKGLTGELHDDKFGGWYAGRSAEGGVLPGKQCYAHAFVILAASSAKLAGIDGADELLDEALSTYDKYFWDEAEGLAVDTWDTEFKELSDYRGLNANMHTVEAFLAATDVTGDVRYRERAGRIIDRVIGWAKENEWRIPEHFSEKWVAELDCNKDKPDDCFKPYGATPGHGIEWARLITQWALASFGMKNSVKNDCDGTDAIIDDAAVPYIEAAKKLYDRAVSDAWNVDGAPGLCYTTDWDGAPVVHDRMHWTLAEAINTSAVLYRVCRSKAANGEGLGTSDDVKRYALDYEMFMKYLDECVIDHKNGSWFHQLDRLNNVIGTVWPGKSDLYHAVQAMLIPYCGDVGVSIAVDVKNRR